MAAAAPSSRRESKSASALARSLLNTCLQSVDDALLTHTLHAVICVGCLRALSMAGPWQPQRQFWRSAEQQNDEFEKAGVVVEPGNHLCKAGILPLSSEDFYMIEKSNFFESGHFGIFRGSNHHCAKTKKPTDHRVFDL